MQHPITLQKSTKLTKTYSGQTGPMVGYATITFCYDPDGQFVFPLTVWITEVKTQNLLVMDFCQKQVSGIHFGLPGIELKKSSKFTVLWLLSPKQTLSSLISDLNDSTTLYHVY